MRRITSLGAIVVVMLAVPAPAQLLGGGGRLAPTVGGVTGGVLGNHTVNEPGVLTAPLDAVQDTLQAVSRPADLVALRRERLRTLVRNNRDVLDVDDRGAPVRRGEVIGIGLSAASLATAERVGLKVVRTERVDGIDVAETIFAAPPREEVRKAISRLQAADPGATYTLDHIYQPAGGTLMPMRGPVAGGGGSAPGARIGLIDGGVGSHPAFAQAHIEQRGFAGDPKPSGHGTAVASLLVGDAGLFHGAATGSLLVADVYGGSAANGSAAAIVRAMGWLALRGATVVNISLVGPPNLLLEAAVRALDAKGVMIVAAVGNDGPAAPPQYPASYPGVVSVTGVDGKNRALIEAGRPTHLDFAAPGADMAGAIPGGGWEALRGTSFAAPLVAARLAARGSVDGLASEARPGTGKVGRGIVCGDCRIAPRSVGLK